MPLFYRCKSIKEAPVGGRAFCIIAVFSSLAPIDAEAYRWPVARQRRQWRCDSTPLFVYNCEFAIDYFMNM
jgi:hypothetical protein